MKETPDKFYDLAIVDVPYGIGESGQRNRTGDRHTPKWRRPRSQNYTDKTWDVSSPDENYFWELSRISKNMIIWGANHFLDRIPFLLDSSCWIVWDKMVDEKEHLSMVELAWTSFDTKAMKFECLWAGFKKGEPTDRIHPTQKPIKLYKWLLKNYAKEGDKILDSHMGSGSSRIAAFDMGFDFTGYELDKDYFDAAEKRFQNHKAQLQLFQP
jgi:site-specific DNA-methyltransferase (adenine-specific)